MGAGLSFDFHVGLNDKKFTLGLKMGIAKGFYANFTPITNNDVRAGERDIFLGLKGEVDLEHPNLPTSICIDSEISLNVDKNLSTKFKNEAEVGLNENNVTNYIKFNGDQEPRIGEDLDDSYSKSAGGFIIAGVGYEATIDVSFKPEKPEHDKIYTWDVSDPDTINISYESGNAKSNLTPANSDLGVRDNSINVWNIIE